MKTDVRADKKSTILWPNLQKPLGALKFECDFCVSEKVSFKMDILIFFLYKKSVFEIDNKAWSNIQGAVLS